MTRKYKTLLFDVETNGLLKQLDRIHCLVIREFESGDTFTFRHNDEMNNIAEGVEMLINAEAVSGHNIISFDIPAISKIFPGFYPEGKVIDTLVMCRMIFTNVKDGDFKLFRDKVIPGWMIGSQGLEAWGKRLGILKGDYKKEREAAAKAKGMADKAAIVQYIWGTWNQEMEDYCVQDVEVTEQLFKKIELHNSPAEAQTLEHQVHDLMAEQEKNGFPFRTAEAEKLADVIELELDHLKKETVDHFGVWYMPTKKYIVDMLWDDPKGINQAKEYQTPREEYGEDYSRAVWGEVTVIPRTTRYKDPMKADRIEGATFCAVKRKEFNPQSRDHIIDRFVTIYDWLPVEFTKTGRPKVDDDVLKTVINKIPMAEKLAEIFYLKKRLGQIRDGKNAWLKHVTEAGFIHHHCNVGGTVSGRASHSHPNLGQVPSVKKAKVIDKATGKKVEVVLKGREGLHGYDCRDLFTVPSDDWLLMGCDLSGIEFRCLANLAADFDDGDLVETVLHGDIHQMNANAIGTDRDTAKTFLYATLYGAGAWKIGHTVNPEASDFDKKSLGIKLRKKWLKGVPALAKVMNKVQGQARMSALKGLDGRLLFSRSEHSALNLKLQSDAALVAKKWVLLFEEYMLAADLQHSWDGDFVMLAWVHDEIQVAVRRQDVALAEKLAIRAAQNAGKYFKFKCPIDAEAKHGRTWAETH